MSSFQAIAFIAAYCTSYVEPQILHLCLQLILGIEKFLYFFFTLQKIHHNSLNLLIPLKNLNASCLQSSLTIMNLAQLNRRSLSLTINFYHKHLFFDTFLHISQHNQLSSVCFPYSSDLSCKACARATNVPKIKNDLKRNKGSKVFIYQVKQLTVISKCRKAKI